MKNKEKHPNIKIVTFNTFFKSAFAKYEDESILRDSVDLAEVFVKGKSNQRKEYKNYTPTDLFILCCNSDNENILKSDNDLLKRARENGSRFFTSVVITTNFDDPDNFPDADLTIPIKQDHDFEMNVVRLLQLLVEISIKQGIGAVDFADIKTLLHYRGIGFFKFGEIKKRKNR